MEDLFILKRNPLFASLTMEQIQIILKDTNAFAKKYDKDEIITAYTQPVLYAGIVLEGKIAVSLFNRANNVHTVHIFKQGELFQEAYASIEQQHTVIEVSAIQNCRILFLDLRVLMKNPSIPNASIVVSNLVKLIAHMNAVQMEKIEILSQRSIREKLIVYFDYLSIRQNSSQIRLPFSRQQLANYLCVNRSALSRELTFMKEEGLISYDRNIVYLQSDEFLVNHRDFAIHS